MKFVILNGFIRGEYRMKKAKYIILTLLVLLYGVIFFVASPNLNPLYGDGLAFWGFVITSFTLVLWLLNSAGKFSDVVSTRSGTHGSFQQAHFKLPRIGFVYLAVAVAPWILLIVISIFSSVLFNSDKYRDQLPQPETRKFTSDVQAIDVSQLPIVDYDLAGILADKKLGEKPALGSQVTLGNPTIQKVDGKLVWVTPLLHSGFFKWLSNMGGTPGYIVVSATNPRDVTYVDKYQIKYQPNAYLLDNLLRHTRYSGGLFKGITDYSFELDDSGKPYWVVTTYKNLVGFELPEATGVITIDAATGAASTYSINNVPSWVDRVQPQSYLMDQINNRGQYIHGIFNFSNKDKFKAAEGNAIVYNSGRCYLFTSITSVGSDESVTGFMLVDMVTKKPYLYQIGGATEYAAQKSAEGKVQQLKYNASFPLMTNVNGQPAYFMTLKDNAGLIKQYAFVSVTDYTTVGTGESLQDALNNYQNNLRAPGGSAGIGSTNKQETVEGTVLRIASEQSDSTTLYKIIIKERSDKIFTAVADVSQELSLTREGDRVKITFSETNGPVLQASDFDNLMFTQK